MDAQILPKQLLSKLKKNRKITACYLFGSYLKNPPKARDIDICLLTEKMNPNEMARISMEFDAPIDLSFMERMSNSVAFNVFRDGKPLFISNKEAHAKKWVQVVHNHLEHEPMRRRIFSGVLKWMNSKTRATG